MTPREAMDASRDSLRREYADEIAAAPAWLVWAGHYDGQAYYKLSADVVSVIGNVPFEEVGESEWHTLWFWTSWRDLLLAALGQKSPEPAPDRVEGPGEYCQQCGSVGYVCENPACPGNATP